MLRPERVSNIQALAWVNAIAEDDPGDESKSENICESLDHGSANSDQVRLTWKVISSDGSDSHQILILMTWSKLILHHVNFQLWQWQQ